MAAEQEFTDFELNVNLADTQAWDGEQRPPLPIGDYKVKVFNVKNEPSKNGTSSLIKVTFDVIEDLRADKAEGGDQTGGRCYAQYNISNDTGLKRLKSFMVAANMRLDKFSAAEALGAEMEVSIQHRVQAGMPDANGNPTPDKVFADVFRERPLPAAAKQAPATTQRPPVTQKAATNGQTRRA